MGEHPTFCHVDVVLVNQEIPSELAHEGPSATSASDVEQAGPDGVSCRRNGTQGEDAGHTEVMIADNEPTADGQYHLARQVDRRALSNHEPEHQYPLKEEVSMT